MTRPEGPPRLEISDPVLSGRSEQSQGPSRLQRIGIHAAGVVLVAVGVLGMVQAGMVNEQRSAEVEAAAAAYSDLDDELRSAQEEVRSVPSLPQARRWVTSATSTAQSVADKQNFLMDATSPWDSGVLEPTERLPSQAGRDPDPQALQEHHENWVSDRVEQTERELVMLFASDQRDAQGSMQPRRGTRLSRVCLRTPRATPGRPLRVRRWAAASGCRSPGCSPRMPR